MLLFLGDWQLLVLPFDELCLTMIIDLRLLMMMVMMIAAAGWTVIRLLVTRMMKAEGQTKITLLLLCE